MSGVENPLSVADDGIRERHGIACKNGDRKASDIVAYELGDDDVVIRLDYAAAIMTPAQARYFASKLYRLSRRIRARATLARSESAS